MNRLPYVIVMLVWCMCGSVDAQPVMIEFDAPGFGANIPVESYSFGMRDYYMSPGRPGPRVTDVVVTRIVDASSPDFFNAALNGTHFSTARIQACSPDCALPTSKYLSIKMENALINSYSTSSGGGVPTESVSFNYTKIMTEYKPMPESPKSAWGVILPQNVPPGAVEPFDFDFLLNPTTLAAHFERPLSDLGNSLPVTLLHVNFIPEPGVLELFLAGLAAIVSAAPRLRRSAN